MFIAAAVVTLMAAFAIATWFLWPERKWTVESSRPFISTLALEGEPAFSADGKMLAYSAGADTSLAQDLCVRNVAGGDAIKVSSDAYATMSRRPGRPTAPASPIWRRKKASPAISARW